MQHISAAGGQSRYRDCELTLPVTPSLLNRNGMLQGGVISTLLDVACGFAGYFDPENEAPRHGHTLSLSVNFLANASDGTVTIKGIVEKQGASVFFSRGEVWQDSTLIATAQTAFKLRRGTVSPRA